MHNHKKIEEFINNVNSLAEKAAQDVFDKHQEEFEKIIKSEKVRGFDIIQGNGVSCYSFKRQKDGNGREIHSNTPMEKNRDIFFDELSQAQYTRQEAGFKTETIK